MLDPLERYSAVTSSIIDCLKQAGVYVSSNRSKLSPVKPSWWTQELDVLAKEKREARVAYVRYSTKENFDLYLHVEEKAKMAYKKQKSESFRQVCNLLTPETVLKRIWGLIGAFSGKRLGRTNVSSDRSVPEFSELRRSLIGEDRPVMPWRPLPETDVGNPLNREFSEQEFKLALGSCKKDSAPGRDQLS